MSKSSRHCLMACFAVFRGAGASRQNSIVIFRWKDDSDASIDECPELFRRGVIHSLPSIEFKVSRKKDVVHVSFYIFMSVLLLIAVCWMLLIIDDEYTGG